MSKDYKAVSPKPKSAENRPGKSGNPLAIGLLIGLLIGIALSVAVALSVNKSGTPFQEKAPPAPVIPVPPQQPPSKSESSTAKSGESGEISSTVVETDKKFDAAKPEPGKADNSKKEDRFTFYDILTDTAQPTVKPEVKSSQEAPGDAANPSIPATEKIFLQVGAFQTEQEADNTKAKLSLIGLDASVQSASIPGKGILHRVRVGPFNNQDELIRARGELAKNGFNAEPVKAQNSSVSPTIKVE